MRARPWITVVVFLLGLILVDRGLGLALGRAYQHVQTGPEGKINDALAHSEVDLMIFGSSRAANHFSPAVFGERLGLRAYNAGSGGQGIVYARLLESLLLRRGTKARLFLLQIEPRDLYRDDVERGMPFLAHVSDDPLIREVLVGASRALRFKLWSQVYRYSSWGLSPLRRLVVPGKPHAEGFVGLPRRSSQMALDHEPLPEEEGPIRADKEALLRGFAAAGREHGIRVAFVTVPRFDGGAPPAPDEVRALERIRAIAESGGVWMIELHREPSLQDAGFYRDRLHLTGEGARILSSLVADELARRLAGPV
jgi:hypothetical protein